MADVWNQVTWLQIFLIFPPVFFFNIVMTLLPANNPV